MTEEPLLDGARATREPPAVEMVLPPAVQLARVIAADWDEAFATLVLGSEDGRVWLVYY